MKDHDQHLLEAKIVEEAYHVFPGTPVTVCLLTLENGFSVIGEAAAVSLADFDEETGRKFSRQHAKHKMGKIEEYQLRENLYQGRLTSPV